MPLTPIVIVLLLLTILGFVLKWMKHPQGQVVYDVMVFIDLIMLLAGVLS